MPHAKMTNGAMFAYLSKPEQKSIAKAEEIVNMLASMNVGGATEASKALSPFVLLGHTPLPIVKPTTPEDTKGTP